MKIIEAKWNDYVEIVFRGVDIDPNGIQYRETRRAFYAGAMGALGGIMDKTVGTTEEEDNALADSVQAELIEWAKRLARGEV